MTTRIVALSGAVGSGKSTLARLLAERREALVIRTTVLMGHLAAEQGQELPNTRDGLQLLGEELDRQTEGRWVVDAMTRSLAGEAPTLIVIDAVRIRPQVEALREAFGRRLTHVHLETPVEELELRYQRRGDQSGIQELASYEQVRQNPTEAAIDQLRADADIVIDTSRNRPDDVEIRCSARLGLLCDASSQVVDVLIGGQYGSEGKGNVAYFLAPEYDLLVRVGGPNAGHKVPLRNPYTHRQLPSGTHSNQDALLLIGPGATIRVELLLQEIAECEVEAHRLVIDPSAMVIEDCDIDTEASLKAAIGSTGQGGGAAAARRILGRRGDNPNPVRLAREIADLRPYTERTAEEVLAEAYRDRVSVLLEGTQGTSLSLYHGSYPHVTSRDTTVAGCLAEAGIAPRRVRHVVVACRSYPIRVGGESGPMGTEIEWATVSARSKLALDQLVSQEKGSVSGNPRRVAEFDWTQLRRSCQLNGATDIALTFADYLDGKNRDARRFDQLTSETVRFIEEVENVAGVPVSLIVTRFDARSVIDRRHW